MNASLAAGYVCALGTDQELPHCTWTQIHWFETDCKFTLMNQPPLSH